MSKILEFKSSNMTLESIPSRRTVKVEKATTVLLVDGLSDDAMKALNNDKASNTNTFGCTDDMEGVYRELNAPPAGYPLLVTNNQTITIPRDGNYIIQVVGGGGAGACVGINPNKSTQKAWEGPAGKAEDTVVKIGNKTFTALAGTYGGKYNPGRPQISYDGEKGIGGTAGGTRMGPGQSGFLGGGSGYNWGGGGGGGSPFPYRTTLTAEKGRGYRFNNGGQGGYGYGAGGGGAAGSNTSDACGGSSGCLITEKIYLSKDDAVEIKIGKGGAGYYNYEEKIKGGNGATGAVQISWDTDQD